MTLDNVNDSVAIYILVMPFILIIIILANYAKVSGLKQLLALCQHFLWVRTLGENQLVKDLSWDSSQDIGYGCLKAW